MNVLASPAQLRASFLRWALFMVPLILLIALLIDTLQRRLARTLTNLAPALSTWAEGDFSRDIQLGKTNRELHDIEASLNRLRAYLVDLVGTIRGNAEQVAGSSRTLAELRKVVWPSRQQLISESVAVLLMVTIAREVLRFFQPRACKPESSSCQASSGPCTRFP